MSGPYDLAKWRQLHLKMPQLHLRFRSEGVGAGEEGTQEIKNEVLVNGEV